MLPPEKDDGNIEYKRYIMIKINKSIELKEEDINDFQSKLFNKRLTNNLRFNQLASQMKFRISEGNGLAIYYLGINDNGTVYDLSNKERSESINNIRELVKYIECKIDKLIFIDNYVKVIIKNKKFKKLEERNILLLGDTESGKTTFLAYLVKNKIDNEYSKAKLHILNHKHELESGKTSSFTCEYAEYNETNLVFIDSPGCDGINSFKSSRKRNKLILSFDFDLIIFFDKPESIWSKKKFYEDLASYSGIPTVSLNLFDKKSYINLINPISQEQIFGYLNSLFKRSNCKSKNSDIINSAIINNTKLDEINNILYKMDCLFPNDKNSLLSTNDCKNKLKFIFENYTVKSSKLDNSDQLNITFINSYPHQDLGLILSGYLSSGKLKINQKLYCYMDIKIDNKESEMSNLTNPLEVQVKSIYKNGNSINSINSPSIITISIDYCNNFGKNILDVYGDFSKLLRLKDVQVNFLSNFSYKPDIKFKLIWFSYTKDNEYKVFDTLQIMVKNQLINLKKIVEDDSYYYVLLNSKKGKEVFNLNNQQFIYEDIDSYGFGIILTNNFNK